MTPDEATSDIRPFATPLRDALHRLTPDEAIARLATFPEVKYPDDDGAPVSTGNTLVHTFVFASGIAFGTDWNLADAIAALRNHPVGEVAKGFAGHTIYVEETRRDGTLRRVFFETKERE
jgi:hypothetical protein